MAIKTYSSSTPSRRYDRACLEGIDKKAARAQLDRELR